MQQNPDTHHYTPLDWVFPPKCMSCRMIFAPAHNNRYKWICDNCLPLLSAVPEPVCSICGYPSGYEAAKDNEIGEAPPSDSRHGSDTENAPFCTACRGRSMYFTNHRAVFVYDDVIRDLIFDIKYRSRRRTAVGLGHVSADIIKDWKINGDYIIPVPLFKSKKRNRGFNQAADLFHPLSEQAQIPIADDLLIRVKNTAPQSGLSSRAREHNLLDAFKINGKTYNIADKDFILVDDIYTSGATMNGCAKILTENGASSVSCISLSMALSFG